MKIDFHNFYQFTFVSEWLKNDFTIAIQPCVEIEFSVLKKHNWRFVIQKRQYMIELVVFSVFYLLYQLILFSRNTLFLKAIKLQFRRALSEWEGISFEFKCKK